MHGTTAAEGIASPCGFEVEYPVCDIDTASPCHNNFIVLRRVTDDSKDAVTAVLDNFGVLEGDSFAEGAVPIEYGGL